MLRRQAMNQSEIKQSFDLKRLLGYTPTEEQKKLFYDLAVDKMVGRTADGKDRENKTFPRYTEEYAERKGVTRNSVDLILTGDMLNSFEESISGNRVEISIKGDQVGKAHGNITGSYGRSPRKSKARDFFGFKNESDINDILSEVDLQRPQEEQRLNLADLRAAVATLDIGFEDFDGQN